MIGTYINVCVVLLYIYAVCMTVDPVLKEAAMNAAGPTNVTPSPLPSGIIGTYSILYSAHLHSERLFRAIFFFKVCGQESRLYC